MMDARPIPQDVLLARCLRAGPLEDIMEQYDDVPLDEVPPVVHGLPMVRSRMLRPPAPANAISLSMRQKKLVNGFCNSLDNRAGDYFVSAVISRIVKNRKLTKGEIKSNGLGQYPSVIVSYRVDPPIAPGTLFNEVDINWVSKVNEYDVPDGGFVAANWRDYPVKKTFWTLNIFEFRHTTKGIAEFDNLRIHVPYHVNQFGNHGILNKLRRRARMRRVPVESVTAPTIVHEYVSSCNEQRGELDLYPEKQRLGFNHYLVTTYGGGTETKTEVKVDGDGNVVQTKSVKLQRRNSFDADLNFGSCDTPQVAMECDTCGDHYFVYKALVTENGMPCIAQLKITTKSQVIVTSFESKARTDDATVVSIYRFALNDGVLMYLEPVPSAYNFVYGAKRIEYIVGETYTSKLSDDTDEACATGIHFCFSQEDALSFHRIHLVEILNQDVFMV